MNRIDLSTPLSMAATRARETADSLRRQGLHGQAAEHYRQAALLEYRKAEYAPPGSARAFSTAGANLERMADAMLRAAGSGASDPTDPPAATEAASEESRRIASLRIVGQTRWEEIIGHDTAKSALRLSLRLLTATAAGGRQLDPPPAILLYGPPGTGKSMLAAAAAAERGCAFFLVNASDLMSKWFGESSRLAAELFRQARRETAAVVFIDEIDALCRDRAADVTGPERRLLATLLTEISGVRDFMQCGGSVLSVAATNAPWDLDAAALSRFGRQIFVPLPDASTREAMIAAVLGRQGLTCDGPLNAVTHAAQGRSGRQLTTGVRAAVEMMLKRMNPRLLELAPDRKLSVGPIRTEELLAAFAAIAPDTTPERLRQYEAFASIDTERSGQ
ncbi:MAG TPA: ATP-binding protein [Tepidisphaeraceae bacterium]|nr:ATP-binding protein [Tepidisphaeraceae bacterium]